MSESSNKKSGDAGPVIILIAIVVLLAGALVGLSQFDLSNSSSSGQGKNEPGTSANPQTGNRVAPLEKSDTEEAFKDKLLVGKESVHPDVLAITPPEDLVVMLFPADQGQQELLRQEYDQLLEKSPEYKQLMMADSAAWDALVDQVVSGKLDPNQVIGEEAQRFEHQLRDKLLKAEGKGRAEGQASPQLETIFDKALTSRDTKVSHIGKLLKHGAEPSSARARKLILTAQEELEKLNKLKLLVNSDIDLNQPTGDAAMTLLDASMVWGDITIAKYLEYKGAIPDVANMRKIARMFQPDVRLRQSEAYLTTLNNQ